MASRVQKQNQTFEVYSSPLIQHQDIVWVYREIHGLVDSCRDTIGAHTSFFDFFIIDCLIRSLGGLLRNKAIFERSDVLRGRGFKGEDTITKDDYTVARYALHSVGLEFVYAEALGKTGENRPFTVYKDRLPMVMAVYTILTESFARTVAKYREYVDRATELRCVIHHTDTTPLEAAEAAQSLTEIAGRASAIEKKIGADSMYLYGAVRHIEFLLPIVRDYNERVIKAYARIALQLARLHARSEKQIEDNFQQGSMGLHRAVYYFDPSRGKAFSGLARWWIRAAILLHIKIDVNMIKGPSHYWQLHKKYGELAADLGIQGEYSAIAKASGDDLETVMDVYRFVAMNRPVSIEAPLSQWDDSSGRVGDNISDDGPTPEDSIIASLSTIDLYLDALSVDERYVICCSYGMYDKIPQKETLTLRDIETERLAQQAAKVYWEKMRGSEHANV